MSPRKLIFIAIVTLLVLWLLYGVWKLNNTEPKSNISLTGSLSIWILSDTTEWFESIKEWFYEYAPEYKNASIEFRKFSDYNSYQKILLSALADQKWPDIFMVEAWSDTLLEEKVEPIPEEYINISDFDKRFEDIFLPLVVTNTWSEILTRSLRWVPLWYETLGIYYNKSLLLTVPKTWNEVAMMYQDGSRWDIYPTNIGMSPRYTPHASDIIALLLAQSGKNSYKDMDSADDILSEYLAYGTMPITTLADEGVSWWSLADNGETLDTEWLTTIDMFIRGNISFIVWYPSTVDAIEDAKKRAWVEAVNSIILTEKIPQNSLGGTAMNIARYKYFWLSKSTQNPDLWVKFLGYLLTEDAQSRYIQSFPGYIPAQRAFYDASRNTALSNIFSRTKLDSFIPSLGEQLVVFDYGERVQFEQFLLDNIDRNSKIDKNNILSTLSERIQCSMVSLSGEQEWMTCSE